MPDHTIDLPGLLGARICHDLISPVGAIGNGIELLALSGGLAGPESELISESAASANTRLQVFRLAFGRAGAGQVHSVPELRQLLSAYSKDYDLAIDWEGTDALSRPVAKSLLLLVMCLETVIGRAGQIAVQQTEGGWCVSADALRGIQCAPLLHLLEASDDWPSDLTPAQVQFPLARLALEQEKLTARLQIDGSRLSVTLEHQKSGASARRAPFHRLLQDT